MRSLQTYAKFKVGLFTVYQAEGRFSTVWPDTGLEKTYNYDAKVKLFFGISQNSAVMEKYLRALPVLTEVSEQVKAMAHLDMDDNRHYEDYKSQGRQEANYNKSKCNQQPHDQSIQMQRRRADEYLNRLKA